jgi:hypothetical protein
VIVEEGPYLQQFVRPLRLDGPDAHIQLTAEAEATVTWHEQAADYPIAVLTTEGGLAAAVAEIGGQCRDALWPFCSVDEAGFNLLFVHLQEVIATRDTSQPLRIGKCRPCLAQASARRVERWPCRCRSRYSHRVVTSLFRGTRRRGTGADLAPRRAPAGSPVGLRSPACSAQASTAHHLPMASCHQPLVRMGAGQRIGCVVGSRHTQRQHRPRSGEKALANNRILRTVAGGRDSRPATGPDPGGTGSTGDRC